MESKRIAPDVKLFIGSGKTDQLQQKIKLFDANLVLFNHNLAPSQGRNLEKILECRVIDRTELILDIFAQRARSFEGKLQVELAQLQHISSCLIRGWTHLERQKGGIGLRGPGETQLETDRRLLSIRIKSIKKRLVKVAAQRDLSRKARCKSSTPTIALVGYTNAGKSTLFNKLTNADVYAADQLFATLDSTLRNFKMPGIGDVVFADTVGFIRDLPHDLIAAFKSTLDEVCQADLLIHVIDVSSDQREELFSSVLDVLRELGADHIPMLVAYNKIDLKPEVVSHISHDPEGRPKRVWLSLKTGDGMDLLVQSVMDLLQHDRVQTTITLSPDQGAVRARLYELDAIRDESIDDGGNFILSIDVSKKIYESLL